MNTTTPTKPYTADQIDTMLCLWEYMVDRNAEEYRIEPPQTTSFMSYWDNHGTCEMRALVPEISAYVDDVYDIMVNHNSDARYDLGFCFDWDIVPMIFSTITWDATQGWSHGDTIVAAMGVMCALDYRSKYGNAELVA